MAGLITTAPQRGISGCAQGATQVYWAKGDHRSRPGLYGPRLSRLQQVEDELAAGADHLVVASLRLGDIW